MRRPFSFADSWWLDLKLGLRMLAKYPGLALAGGTGIAVAVAIAAGAFSFIRTNYLSPVPLEEGDRLVSMAIWNTAESRPEPRILRDYRVWRDELKSVQEISVFRMLSPNLIVPGARPESVRVAAMSASGFRVARVEPMMGRYLREEDERAGSPAVLVIGESVWRTRFFSDPSILGRTIQLDAIPHTIVGVMPRGFAFPVNDHFWVALRAVSALPEPLTGPEVMAFGRLAPGATIENAQAELAALGQRTAQTFPNLYARLQPQVMPYPRPFVGFSGPDDVAGLLVMQALLVSLLVLVCLNVAILVYTRTAMRQAEIGLRTALGASRGRIVGQLFIEALVLSGVAAAVGVGIAAFALRETAAAMLPRVSAMPFWMSFQLSPEAILYAVALSILGAGIIGIVPALQATRRGLQTGFRVAGSGGLRLGKTWTVLIIAQVGFAVALLPPAVSSAWEDAQDGIAGLGFPAETFLSAQVAMDSNQKFATSQTELIRRLSLEPRVSSVTFSQSIPGDERGAHIELELEGLTQVYETKFNRVDLNYFPAFEVPILAGRGFEVADQSASGAIIVNQPFAEKVFGGSALGRRIRLVGGPWTEIVGIVPDFPTGVSPGMRDTNIRVYHAAGVGQVQPATIAVRMRGGAPSSFVQRLQEVAGAVDPDLHLLNIRGLDDALKSEQWISRMTASIFAAITFSVLLLSSAGIYALMSFTVSQRRKEVGIRMALGADWKQIVASIFSRALLQLAAGASVGLALGILIEKASGGVIMRGNAPVVLPTVTMVIVAVGFLAALGPTRRSLQIQPTEALREP